MEGAKVENEDFLISDKKLESIHYEIKFSN